jgi:hypothetical protein
VIVKLYNMSYVANAPFNAQTNTAVVPNTPLACAGSPVAGAAWTLPGEPLSFAMMEFMLQVGSGSQSGDGFCLVFQAGGPDALGAPGWGMGFVGIPNSLDLCFNTRQDTVSAGIYASGSVPTDGSPLPFAIPDLTGGYTFATWLSFDLAAGTASMTLRGVNTPVPAVTYNATFDPGVFGTPYPQNLWVGVTAGGDGSWCQQVWVLNMLLQNPLPRPSSAPWPPAPGSGGGFSIGGLPQAASIAVLAGGGAALLGAAAGWLAYRRRRLGKGQAGHHSSAREGAWEEYEWEGGQAELAGRGGIMGRGVGRTGNRRGGAEEGLLQ